MKHKLNIQLFGAEDEGAQTPPEGAEGGTQTPPKKSLQELLDSDPELLAEYNENLRTSNMQVQAAEAAKAQAALTEQQRLAQMNEEDRRQEELRIQQEQIDQQRRDVEVRELRLTASAMLAEAGVPQSLIDHVDYTNADSVKSSINTLKLSFESAVRERVQSVAQGTPLPGQGNKTPNPTKSKERTAHEKKLEDIAKRYRVDIDTDK